MHATMPKMNGHSPVRSAEVRLRPTCKIFDAVRWTDAENPLE
jgi:hypothetical protein